MHLDASSPEIPVKARRSAVAIAENAAGVAGIKVIRDLCLVALDEV